MNENDLPPEEDPRYRRMRAMIEFDQWSTSEEEAVAFGFEYVQSALGGEEVKVIDVEVHEKITAP